MTREKAESILNVWKNGDRVTYLTVPRLLNGTYTFQKKWNIIGNDVIIIVEFCQALLNTYPNIIHNIELRAQLNDNSVFTQTHYCDGLIVNMQQEIFNTDTIQ